MAGSRSVCLEVNKCVGKRKRRSDMTFTTDSVALIVGLTVLMSALQLQ